MPDFLIPSFSLPVEKEKLLPVTGPAGRRYRCCWCVVETGELKSVREVSDGDCAKCGKGCFDEKEATE